MGTNMSVSAEEATRVVLAVLAAKTGYEPDMIEMDMALETELGVDSIKRVEILSDVQKELDVDWKAQRPLEQSPSELQPF